MIVLPRQKSEKERRMLPRLQNNRSGNVVSMLWEHTEHCLLRQPG